MLLQWVWRGFGYAEGNDEMARFQGIIWLARRIAVPGGADGAVTSSPSQIHFDVTLIITCFLVYEQTIIGRI
jgi:hypothetical protein